MASLLYSITHLALLPLLQLVIASFGVLIELLSYISLKTRPCDFMLILRKKRNSHEAFMKSVSIFSTTSEYELMKILDATKQVEYKAGQTIIKEGEEGNIFFLLKSGEAYATKVLKPGDKPEKVMDYKTGSYFGELALIKNAPRAANVVAKVRYSKP